MQSPPFCCQASFILAFNPCYFISMNDLLQSAGMFFSPPVGQGQAKGEKRSYITEGHREPLPEIFCPRTNTLPLRLSLVLASDPDRPRLKIDFHFLGFVDNFLLKDKIKDL